MDTLTHALSGALAARATTPARARHSVAARITAGFFACAFPDADVVLSLFSPVTYLTLHRGVTHSMILAPLWAYLLACLFARMHRRKPVSWRDYFGVCLLAILMHIVGDLITSFGTMIYAPFSDARVAWHTTFIIDLWFSGIIVAGLAAAWVWRRSRVPAAIGLAGLAAYVGLQALQHQRAVNFGRRFAESRALPGARVSALPRPVSPFNWMVVVTEGDLYHYANVNLVRRAPLPRPGPRAGLIARLNAAYVPLEQAQWITIHKYGPDPSRRDLAARVLAHPRLGFYRWFADHPALYRIDERNPAICVWFEDLRFTTVGRESSSFRYGLCSAGHTDDWRPFRLRDNGTREAVN
ncbi:MAG TPA: metal-dependent hydrolase [Candidatus Binatia bacterium]|nr:metal-dependent hydrolase [Candidatus Binatia bacterium]